eukprot:2763974-Rhodomonas_salina.1
MATRPPFPACGNPQPATLGTWSAISGVTCSIGGIEGMCAPPTMLGNAGTAGAPIAIGLPALGPIPGLATCCVIGESTRMGEMAGAASHGAPWMSAWCEVVAGAGWPGEWRFKLLRPGTAGPGALAFCQCCVGGLPFRSGGTSGEEMGLVGGSAGSGDSTP